MFWGWMCNYNTKIEPAPGQSPPVRQEQFGGYCNMNDKIGVLLEFNSEDNTCDLSYFRNGSKVDVAFRNMPAAQYYPAVTMMYGDA